MEMIMKDLNDIIFDVKQAASRAGEYRKDIDRGINVNHVGQQEGVPKAKTIEYLFDYLIMSKNDMDQIRDDLKDIHTKLDALMEMLDYERVRKGAGL